MMEITITLQERNIFLLDAAINIFDLSKDKRPNIKRTISAEQVRELYEVIADLWQHLYQLHAVVFQPPRLQTSF